MLSCMLLAVVVCMCQLPPKYDMWDSIMCNQLYSNTRLLVLSACLLLCASIAGCTTAPYLSSLPKCGPDGKAHTGGPQYALLSMKNSRDGVVKLLDGKPFLPSGCNQAYIVLEEGEHTVHFSYIKSYSVLGPPGSDPVALTFSAKAGETYNAVVKTSGFGWRYNCRIEAESTGSVLDEVEDCDQNEVRYKAMQEIFDAYGGRDEYIRKRSLLHH